MSRTLLSSAETEQMLSALLEVRQRSNDVFARVNEDREQYYDLICSDDQHSATEIKISMDEGAAELVRMNVIEADLEAKLHQLGVTLPAIDGKTLVRLLTSCEALRPSHEDQS
jgi:hypothetical protein